MCDEQQWRTSIEHRHLRVGVQMCASVGTHYYPDLFLFHTPSLLLSSFSDWERKGSKIVIKWEEEEEREQKNFLFIFSISLSRPYDSLPTTNQHARSGWFDSRMVTSRHQSMSHRSIFITSTSRCAGESQLIDWFSTVSIEKSDVLTVWRTKLFYCFFSRIVSQEDR